MGDNLENSEQLLILAYNEGLYRNLVIQLQKDFALSNCPLDISIDIKSDQLITAVVEKLYFLMMEKFQEYLNVLYVMDIPEKEFQHIEITDVVEVANQMTFLILKREFKKVWFRKTYQ